jgi:hypothetical protein
VDSGRRRQKRFDLIPADLVKFVTYRAWADIPEVILRARLNAFLVRLAASPDDMCADSWLVTLQLYTWHDRGSVQDYREMMSYNIFQVGV